MEWFSQKKTGPDQTLASVSAPPFRLISILCIVIFLLSLSQYSNYKEQLHQARISFRFSLLLVPIGLIFSMRSSFVSSKLNFPAARISSTSQHRYAREFPWSIAVLVMVMAGLVYYQSLFQSMWFGGSY